MGECECRYVYKFMTVNKSACSCICSSLCAGVRALMCVYWCVCVGVCVYWCSSKSVRIGE